eukprot:TRINITY_DN21791_c0_g1_i1.p1 TRINITY_DN21791_c0_g1~~TRINITY_DN21791_c0_g1_i1.p1  ORF type:complete len:341 (+),score=44.83 TRINITY_DN21791_c0_g1_i1:147-1025(+)
MEKEFTLYKLHLSVDRDAYISEVALFVRGVATTHGAGASADLINRLPNLKIVSSFSVGLDLVDINLCKEKGIAVTNTPNVLSECVADMAMGLLIDARRKISAGDRYVREGKWLGGAFGYGQKVWGRHMGIVGLGSIGEAIAKRAVAFGVRVSYHNRREKDVPYTYYPTLVGLARDVDFLILICPLTPETHHCVNREVLDALGPEGTLVNIARGSVVDEAALVSALADGRLGSAGLDVFEDEPNVPAALLKMDQVVLQPHAGSATVETRAAMGDLVIDNLKAHFSGKPLLTPV